MIRNLGSVDLVEITARAARAGAMMDAFAVHNRASPYGRAVKLAYIMVRPDGTAEIAAQLRFVESGLSSVVLVPAGHVPSGASISQSGQPVLQVAAASHCEMH